MAGAVSGAPAVAVVGSLNLDVVVRVPRHPKPGETVLGGDSARTPGGKGANQAVAAARLGQSVAMVGRVGDDGAGRFLCEALADDGVDLSRLTTTEGVPTGLALITVDPAGENAIVVSPGANGRLEPADVDAAAPLLEAARVCLLQLEVPLAAVVRAAARARGTVVLNTAPARSVPAELMSAADVLVPNRSELGVLLDAPTPETLDEVARLVRTIDGPRSVVVTLGADGALLVADGDTTHVPAVPVEAVDTTAAGDCFCGALADALGRGERLEAAVRWAVRAAAVATTRPGASASLPTRDEVEAVAAPAG
jgi:ribokinase